MPSSLVIIGVPSSAGAYGPGQEKAPSALRTAGLMNLLISRNIPVEDKGDVVGFRWVADTHSPRAMNIKKVASSILGTANLVTDALDEDALVLILGGDCTVEIGTVAGAIKDNESVGMVYIDFDTDLNTPQSTDDGALDWMGVAHMLGVDGADQELVQIGPRVPLLGPDQILFFAHENVKPFERKIIQDKGIAEMPLNKVAANPSKAAQSVVDNWAKNFDRLLIHLDVDVLDFADIPLAENTRRNKGLRFNQLMESLRVLLLSPNFTALTITELNPDHGELDGSTLRVFAEELADAFCIMWENRNY